MEKKDKRFVITYSQGTLDMFQVLVDRETGVNYLWLASGYGGGLTPLLDREGNPIITTVFEEEE